MKSYNYREYVKNVLPCAGYAILCGALTGVVIFLFKLVAHEMESISRFLYGLAKTSLAGILLAFLGLILASLAMLLLHRHIPEAAGGGIPRSEGILRGMLSFRWLKTFFGTFAGSMLSFFCGLPLGSEGPAVLLGTSLGHALGGSSKRTKPWERYVMSGGAGAGFAIATGAPLSGILFALEEIHRRFTPLLVVTVSLSTLSATLVNSLLCQWCGLSPRLFEIPTLGSFELKDTVYLLLLGLLISLAVSLFDGSIYLFNRITKHFRRVLPKSLKLTLMFLLTGILGLWFADGIYSGHAVIDHLLISRQSAWLILAILSIRLCMMLFATDCGATGGLFIPTLAVGALISALFARLLIAMGMSSALYAITVLLGMCAFLGGTLRSPLTAAVFFLELTGQFTNLFFVALVIFIVYLITDLVNLTSFYDRVMEKMERDQNAGKEAKISCFEVRVSHNSFAVGKTVRDIMWPSSSIILGHARAEETDEDLDNEGEKKIYAEDTLLLRARYYDEAELRRQLYALVGTDFEIQKTTLSTQ